MFPSKLRWGLRFGLVHLGFLPGGIAVVVVANDRLDAGLDPFEAERVFHLALGEQGLGGVGMLGDNLLEQVEGLLAGGGGLVAVMDLLIGKHSPGVRLGLGEFERILL